MGFKPGVESASLFCRIQFFEFGVRVENLVRFRVEDFALSLRGLNLGVGLLGC